MGISGRLNSSHDDARVKWRGPLHKLLGPVRRDLKDLVLGPMPWFRFVPTQAPANNIKSGWDEAQKIQKHRLQDSHKHCLVGDVLKKSFICHVLRWWLIEQTAISFRIAPHQPTIRN